MQIIGELNSGEKTDYGLFLESKPDALPLECMAGDKFGFVTAASSS